MDIIYIIINIMVVSFGLGSLTLTIVLLSQSYDNKIILFLVTQISFLVRHIFWLARFNNPLLDLAIEYIQGLFLLEYLVSVIVLICISILINAVFRLQYKKVFLYLIIPLVSVFIYAITSLFIPWIPSAAVHFPLYLWLIIGYGPLLYYSVILLFQLKKDISQTIKRRIYLIVILTVFFVILMTIDEYIVLPRHLGYGLLSFPLFVLTSNCLSIIILSSIHHKKDSKRTFSSKFNEVIKAFNLSNREVEIALLLAKGTSYKEIGDQLFISLGTVKSHAFRIYKKTDVANRLELVNLIKN